ncbi:MAG: ParA family protein [Chlamydiales bacterium]|nr:ParA family protein [Chlamydiales bacterium]
MSIIAIINQKGGSAKTTTAVNLGATLAENGKKVLLVDVDPQGSSSKWLRCANTEKGIYNVFVENTCISDNIKETSIEGLTIIPSSQWLIGVEKALAAEVGAETILKRKLAELKREWDYVLIDCPPALGLLSLNALVAAHEILVPLETRIMALDGLAQLLKTVEMVKDRLNPELKINGIIPCRVDKRTRLSVDVIDELKKRFNGMVYDTCIRETVKLAECPSFGQPITIYDTKSPGAEDYRTLAAEVIKRKKI